MSLSKPMNKQNNPTYRFEVIPKSWSKRRKPDEELKILTVEIPDFELKEQHFCNMHVHYEDGSENVLFSCYPKQSNRSVDRRRYARSG